uniref:Ras-associating domain-containing protein n=1 Tax=Salarias fasciatus TaxID=181472 RepID=A0A672IG80_SALFA
MFYGSSSGASMSLPSKSRLKRQSRTFTQVKRPADDPAELSTQSSAPGVLKIFGDEICAGANYKSVLATPRSSAQELVKEALERYSLNKDAAHSYVLCDVIGRLEGGAVISGSGIGGGGWRTECLRALGDNEKPLLLQELWKPREGHARRFELRRRAEVEELNAKEKDTITADINAQARKLQRNRAKGTLTLPRSSNSSFCRSLSETSLNQVRSPAEAQKEDGGHGGGGGGVKHSLYQSPHLLLLQGYNRQGAAHGRTGDSVSPSQYLPLFSRHPAPPLPLTPRPRTPAPSHQQQQVGGPALHHASTRRPPFLRRTLHLSVQRPFRSQTASRANLGTPSLARPAVRHRGRGGRGRSADL